MSSAAKTTAGDPRPALGDIMMEIIRAGGHWQVGEQAEYRSALERARADIDFLRRKATKVKARKKS
jgi:hypothetical protein